MALLLRGFAPLPRQPLAFTARRVASDDGSACSVARAEGLARDRGAGPVLLPDHEPVNAASGLGHRDRGRLLLDAWREGLFRRDGLPRRRPAFAPEAGSRLWLG